MISHSSRISRCLLVFAAMSLPLGLFCAGATQVTQAQDKSAPPATSPPDGKDNAPQGTVKLKIVVTNPKGNPVANASVYVRYPKPGGLLHHDDLAEMDLKTNQDGSVKVPPVPRGKVQIQVIAQGWHTFGEWFDVEKDDQQVTIQLQEPPHWY
jgi:hypothetical protein